MIGLTPGQQRGLLIILGLVLAATFLAHLAGRSGGSSEALAVGVRVDGLVARPGLYLFPRPPQTKTVLALAGAQETAITGEEPIPSGSWLVVGPEGITRLKAPPAERLLLGLPLDLNAAAASDLTLLPGIGPVLAQRIVAARHEKGPFQSLDDLLAVPGLGSKTLDRLKPWVELGEKPPS